MSLLKKMSQRNWEIVSETLQTKMLEIIISNFSRVSGHILCGFSQFPLTVWQLLEYYLEIGIDHFHPNFY
jgi:hypothetical protein